ncbi:hypothetical protein CTAYLR_002977 [Chrysophaeum taylorii]|uniref:Methylated-DNA--protein-cysteine methyltransferase n=1 Tax=Chrysophaeum taylorii TaxID=2483200 RepID=A0AAD7U542_9STRA|nr:hypothetical protein CTAYLR_002977 [Chrysophaeum taylorii]
MSRKSSAFETRVYEAVRQIPSGMATSYGAVAVVVGSSPRSVGSAMRRCQDRSVPCHRVIAADRRLGGFGGCSGGQWNRGGAVDRKRKMLEAEGVEVGGDGRVSEAAFLDEVALEKKTNKRRRRLVNNND